MKWRHFKFWVFKVSKVESLLRKEVKSQAGNFWIATNDFCKFLWCKFPFIRESVIVYAYLSVSYRETVQLHVEGVLYMTIDAKDLRNIVRHVRTPSSYGDLIKCEPQKRWLRLTWPDDGPTRSRYRCERNSGCWDSFVTYSTYSYELSTKFPSH